MKKWRSVLFSTYPFSLKAKLLMLSSKMVGGEG
jgi:hypothetical protein